MDEELFSELTLMNHGDTDFLFSGFGMHDDTSRTASALRFSVGNRVIYKTEDTNGWTEGEVVKVNQCMRFSRDRSQCIAYVIWPHREMPDDEIGTEWVFEDTDEFIRPRPEDLTPDPAKFKPLLAAPEDPYYYLYTNTELFDSKTEEGTEMVDLFRGLDGVDNAMANPDGSVKLSLNGRKVTTACVKFPEEPVLGVDPCTSFMFATNQLHVRERSGINPLMIDMIDLFKSLDPAMSLAQLEEAAKSSNCRRLQLADCIMVGLNGWPRDPKRACNLYRAAAWGCTEEEEPTVRGIPVGDPKAMVAVASMAISYISTLLGYAPGENCPFREWMGEGLRNADSMRMLFQAFFWLTNALRYHGHTTSLTLMVGKTIQDMNFGNDRRLTGEIGQDLKDMAGVILRASEYRDKEVAVMDMQENGLFPRGDPSEEVLHKFKPHALKIFQSLPKSIDTIHIEFKQVSRPPFPMIVMSFLPAHRKFVKIVRLSKSLQLTPFSLESFEHVWLQIAFDIHLGRLGTNERCRPKSFTVLDDGHGNRAFALYLKQLLGNCGTEVRLVQHSDMIKTGKRSRSCLGDLVSELMTVLLKFPIIYSDDESRDDFVARAQDDYVDHLVSQQIVSDGDANVDAWHLLEAERIKQRGNHHFQAQDYISAIRCYSIGIGHLRRVIEHNQDSYKLLGTTLSNRAACFLALLDASAQRSYSTEFRKVHAGNAINDCTTALESSWASSSLPQSILDKLRFRRDKAAATYDSLNDEMHSSMADILFPRQSQVNGHVRNIEIVQDENETIPEDNQQGIVTGTTRIMISEKNDADALVEYGEDLYKNQLAKNSHDGCPICLREFNGELDRSFSVVLPCGEHALCAKCTCSLKIQADKVKQCPQCPLCRFSFNGDFIEGIPSVIIEKDQTIANLIVQLSMMDHEEKIAIAERLLWTHRFDVSAVVDAIEELLDGRVSGLFFRSEGDLTHTQKEEIYRKARIPVEKLEEKLKHLLHDLSLADSKSLSAMCCNVRQVRKELGEARERAREDIYNKMNTVGSMGAEREGGMIQVDYHGLHVNELRKKFKDHIIPIIPAVGKVTVITGRGSHSVGKESKLKKALLKLIGEYKNLSWQRVEGNDGAIVVLWKPEKK